MAGKKKTAAVAADGSKVNKSKAIREAIAANAGMGNKDLAALVTESLGVEVTALNVGAVRSQLNKKSRTAEVKVLSGPELAKFNTFAKQQGGLTKVKEAIATAKSILLQDNIGSLERADEAVLMLESLIDDIKKG